MSNLKGYDGSVQGKVKFALHHLHSVECLTTVIYLYPELKKKSNFRVHAINIYSNYVTPIIHRFNLQ